MDIHEYFRNSIGIRTEDNTNKYHSSNNVQQQNDINVEIKSIFGMQDENKIRNIFLPQYNYVSNYLFLDNQGRSTDYDGTYKTKWYIVEESNSTIAGAIIVAHKIKNVVAMNLRTINIAARSTEIKTQLDRNQITFLIEEFKTQSFINPEGNNFHFVGKYKALSMPDQPESIWSPSASAPVAECRCISCYEFNRGWFRFSTPITEVSSITMSLYSPTQPLAIDATGSDVANFSAMLELVSIRQSV